MKFFSKVILFLTFVILSINSHKVRYSQTPTQSGTVLEEKSNLKTLWAKLAEGAMFVLSNGTALSQDVQACEPISWKVGRNDTSTYPNLTTAVQDMDNLFNKMDPIEFNMNNFRLFLNKTNDYACVIKEDIIKFFVSTNGLGKKKVFSQKVQKTQTKWNLYNFIRDNDELLRKVARDIQSGKTQIRQKPAVNPMDPLSKKSVTPTAPTNTQQKTVDANGNTVITNTVYTKQKRTAEQIYDDIVFALNDRIKPALDQFEYVRDKFMKIITNNLIKNDFKYIFDCLSTKTGILQSFKDIGNNFFKNIENMSADDSKIRFPLRMICNWKPMAEAIDNYLKAKSANGDLLAQRIYFGKVIGGFMVAIGINK